MVKEPIKVNNRDTRENLRIIHVMEKVNRREKIFILKENISMDKKNLGCLIIMEIPMKDNS